MPKTLRFFLALGLLALALFPLSSAFAQDPNAPIVRITQVDNSKFPQVTVYVSVTNAAGEPVAVDPATIQIQENGQMMQATSVSGQGDIGPLTTLLVMDISGSMEKGDKITAAKTAAKAYIDQMRSGDQAGLISFNTAVNLVQPVTSDKNVLASAVDSLQPAGNTAMFDALIQGVDVLKNISGRKGIILLSDGIDNRSHSSVDDVINTIGPAGLSISTIGLGDPTQSTNNFGLDEPALKSLAERAGGFYGFATAPQDLLALYQQRGAALQNEMSFSYASPATLRDGVNRNVQVSFGGDPALTTAGGYNPGGVLPEVASRSWPLFALIMIGLILLLGLPFLISRGAHLFSGLGKKNAPAAAASGNRGRGVHMGAPAPRSSAVKGRVRLK
ncbi:MAG TPA: VWA domain-containing protein [Anaerolineales bacterium]